MAKPKTSWLGKGLARKAGEALKNRQKQIDSAVDGAVTRDYKAKPQKSRKNGY